MTHEEAMHRDESRKRKELQRQLAHAKRFWYY